MFNKKSSGTADSSAPASKDTLQVFEDSRPSSTEATRGSTVLADPKSTEHDQQPSVISQAVRMEGSIVSSGPLHLHCDLVGQVTAPFVLIGATGKAEGNINVTEINVEGSLNGEVNCKLLKAGRNASLHGDISCENLEVELGASVSGSLAVGRPAKS